MSQFVTIDPSNGRELASYETLGAEMLAARIEESLVAFADWARSNPAHRAEVLRSIAQQHRARANELAVSMAAEMGKPVSQGVGELELAASVYEYYADNGPEWLADESVDVSIGSKAVIRTEALGPVLGVMPWNFPLYQVARFVAPNLMVGNTILLKHARACAGTSELLAEVMTMAGVPAGVYENLIIESGAVEFVISHPAVQGVSFTGSESAGRAVAAVAGQNLKKCILELGGSDPFIVLPDADLDQVFASAVRGRFWNAGQVCNGAKRMIVHEQVWDEFIEGLSKRASEWLAGDPRDPETNLGPMASDRGRREVHEQVTDAVRKGAEVHVGGELPDSGGYFYPMTVLSGVNSSMRAYREEIFGPVAVAYKVSSVEEAITLANDSDFGLGSAVFSADPETVERVVDQLVVGMVGVNTTIRSQPSLPFGGTKTSGLGRELGRLGFDEFSNKKVLQYA